MNNKAPIPSADWAEKYLMTPLTLPDSSGMYNISSNIYHNSPGLSRSAIMSLRKTPKHYWADYISLEKPEKEIPTALHIGSAFHTLVLEPHLFDKEVVICDYKTWKSKDAQIEYDNILSADKTPLLTKDFELIQNMKKSLDENIKVKKLLDGATFEKSIYWTDKDNNILCKSRPDIMYIQNKEFAYVADLKSTNDASIKAFERAIYDYGYHIQCAMIREALKEILQIETNLFFFIVVEKEYPFATAIYQLDIRAIDFGLKEFKDLLIRYKVCVEKNEWPDYGVAQVSLPSYILFK